jgi:hypothetical protein
LILIVYRWSSSTPNTDTSFEREDFLARINEQNIKNTLFHAAYIVKVPPLPPIRTFYSWEGVSDYRK